MSVVRWKLLVGVCLVAGLVSYGASSARSISRPAGPVDRARLHRCVKAFLGLGRSATPVSGSAGSHVVASFSVFRQPRSPADALPAVAHLREALASAGARTYDPSAAVRLTNNGGAAYAVPATVSSPT